MISLESLKDIGRIKGLNLGQAEKDYLLDLTLSIISRATKDELIFKGGTCLNRFYRLARFSEDLDFSQQKEMDKNRLSDKIRHDLRSFGIDSELLQKKEPFNSVLITLRTKGPLYSGKQQTVSKIQIDINIKSAVEIQPILQKYASMYMEVPAFSVLTMDEREILAEKIRAVLTRNKPRDAYDLWFLLSKGVELDMKLVDKKLEYYSISFDMKEFNKSLENKKGLWENELKSLVSNPPEFEAVKKQIISKLKAALN